MANLIQTVKRKTSELIAIKWDGDGMSAYEIKSMLAKHRIGVFYIAPDDWHHTLTSEEQQGLVYYNPYLVINAGRNDIRFEKDQCLVLNPEASSLEPRVTIMSEEELRQNYDNAPDDDQAEGSDYRAAEDLAGHGDGELRERDALGGESGDPEHEDEPNV